ncbi:MAG: membrane protein insertase YidC, partial [Rhodovarius sp.]|nr:membrane protein insertase YidC [Rhodovarius sp.]MDW8315110.1 membrane protein insertase YidC [Rhodovarius sp.]
MDQKRLLAAIALSIGILLIFDVWNRTQAPPPTQRPVPEQTTADGAPLPAAPVPAPAALPGEA